MTAPLTVLQVTDTHLRAPAASSPDGRARQTLLGVDTADSLAAVLDQALAERRPDAVVVSGDLAHDAEEATYRRLQTLLQQRYHGPVLYLPGNHDLSAPLARVLGTAGSLSLGDWEIIGFDSHGDDQVEASFDAKRRRELLSRIGACRAAHALLVCHHPPWPVGCPWLDNGCIPDGQALLDSCGAQPGQAGAKPVRGLLFGHVHQEAQGTSGGLIVLGTPSTCFQFEPRSAAFAIDRSADTGQPGYRWVTLHSDGAIESQVDRVRGYALNIDLSDRS